MVNAAVGDGHTYLEEEYKCTICLGTIYEPLECKSCEIACFCAPCIKQYGKDICPTCKSAEGFKNLNRKTKNHLNSLMVKCDKC